jgi:hypothetical protein
MIGSANSKLARVEDGIHIVAAAHIVGIPTPGPGSGKTSFGYQHPLDTIIIKMLNVDQLNILLQQERR